ncbi:uncharacterized protein LOC131855333 [Achroia grisella]|uniref:uncharacterized protein LOC131855333 n=1 Tax=Achroia grisella TaxID=688607 RepID=UPI0027D27CF6|nr:uncharacterized protein LOC131855333 [Achroia grisella]
MDFNTDWAFRKHRMHYETAYHWHVRHIFMNKWKRYYPERKLVYLSWVLANIKFRGCRYPKEIMQEIILLTKDDPTMAIQFSRDAKQFSNQSPVECKESLPLDSNYGIRKEFPLPSSNCGNLERNKNILASQVSNRNIITMMNYSQQQKKILYHNKRRRREEVLLRLLQASSGAARHVYQTPLNRSRTEESRIFGVNKQEIYDESKTMSKNVMAIVAENYPAHHLGEEDYALIQEVIWKKLELNCDPLPKFNMMRIVSGAIHVNCDGKASADWLYILNGSIINGIKLNVLNIKDLPRPIKMAWKSRNIGCLKPERVLTMLQRFHPDLVTASWDIVATQVDSYSVRRVVFVDWMSAQYIKKKGFKLYTGVDLSIFKVLDYPENILGKFETPDCEITKEIWPTRGVEREHEMKTVFTPKSSTATY